MSLGAETPYERLMRYAERGNKFGVMKAVADGADPREPNSMALRLAAASGSLACLKYLVPLSNPNEGDFVALAVAAEVGSVECVEYLMTVTDLNRFAFSALCRAAGAGNLECIRLLIGHVDSASIGLAVDSAARFGCEKCVGFLMERCEPGYYRVSALAEAAKSESVACVRLLLPVCDVEGAKDLLGDEEEWSALAFLESLSSAALLKERHVQGDVLLVSRKGL